MENLSRTYPNARFVKVDVDRLQRSAQSAGVRAMPTIHAYRDGRQLGEVVGADMGAIESLIRTHYAAASFTGAGQSLSSSSAAAATAAGSKLFDSLVASSAATSSSADECELQIRLSNGQTIRGTFRANSTLADVKQWVVANRTDAQGDRFNLTTTFPRRCDEVCVEDAVADDGDQGV